MLNRVRERTNREFDSRLLRVTIGAAGVTRPQVTPNGQLAKVYCLNCGKPGGAVSGHIPPALRGDPGVIYICLECDAKMGGLPAHAVGFERRRER